MTDLTKNGRPCGPDDESVLRAEAESTMPALTEREIEGIVRAVTNEEVAHYVEFGSVMVRRLQPFCTFLCYHSVGIPCIENSWKVQNDSTSALD